ncbi:hypothetical protein RM764_21015 [Streptomyces sp. DSM 41699]|uniref:Transposase n=1 Tax=Streptomyces gibsoniae TaxID=3075529 RepID=A0ABU2TWV8_9ACTN|nr:hypothetical protein [Streptomyces sp. DSM 41699]MDT0465452.1 hypothetical protein [Streptomyces sp. DSM 41699]
MKSDDLPKASPPLAPWRPAIRTAPQLTDGKLVTLAVMQAVQGFTSVARWLRYACSHLRRLFALLAEAAQLRQAPTQGRRAPAASDRLPATDTSVGSDDVWITGSTPVECGRSGQTVKRYDPAGWAEYGCCAGHSRLSWGLRLHLVCTPQGLPIAFAPTGAKGR